MFVSGVDRNKRTICGVATFVDDTWLKKYRYMYKNERIVTVAFKTKIEHLTVTGVYGSEDGRK